MSLVLEVCNKMFTNVLPNQNKALFYAQHSIAQIVTDVVNLEDINFTVPEVQTLLDGITVGGHKIQDELITINQIKSWKFLFNALKNNQFELSKKFVLELHNLVANEEALEWGCFRTGMVSISGTKHVPAKVSELDCLWDNLIVDIVSKLEKIKSLKIEQQATEVYQSAIFLFGEMARAQFFWDGNKRTARMMMSGILISYGYPMINVSARHKLEFNQTMIRYYDEHNFSELFNFMCSCVDKIILNEFKIES